MDWREYRDTYQSYELSVSQSRVVTVVAKETLKDFPTQVPKTIAKPLRETMREVRNFLASPDRIVMNVTETHEIAKATLSMYFARENLGISTEDVDFERALDSQALVMLFAHIDSFMSDSLEAICRVRPEVMKSSKKMDWESIISYGGWEELLDHMIEDYVFQFGWQSVAKRIEFLREQLGITIDCEDIEIELIGQAENIRNIVVHDGGRVSEEYLKRTGRTDLGLGELVPITSEFVDRAFQVTRTLAGDLFIAVSKDFFGRDNLMVAGVWRRRGCNPSKSTRADSRSVSIL